MHLVLTLPSDTDEFSVRLRLIKLLFAKGLPRTERLSASRRKRHDPDIWQRRFWEHAIRDERDFAHHAVAVRLGRCGRVGGAAKDVGEPW